MDALISIDTALLLAPSAPSQKTRTDVDGGIFETYAYLHSVNEQIVPTMRINVQT